MVYGLGQPLVQACLTGAMSKSMSADIQGRVQGSIAAVMALAQVVGPLGVGWLYQALSPSTPYWTISAEILISVALVFIAIPKLKHLRRLNHAMNNEPNHNR